MRSTFASLAIVAAAATLAVAAFAKTVDAGNSDRVVLVKSGDKYCASTMITGSILPQKTCKSRADWIAAGARVEKSRS